MDLDLDDVPQLNTDKYNKGKSLKVVKFREISNHCRDYMHSAEAATATHHLYITIIIMLDYVNEAMHTAKMLQMHP